MYRNKFDWYQGIKNERRGEKRKKPVDKVLAHLYLVMIVGVFSSWEHEHMRDWLCAGLFCCFQSLPLFVLLRF